MLDQNDAEDADYADQIEKAMVASRAPSQLIKQFLQKHAPGGDMIRGSKALRKMIELEECDCQSSS